MRTSESTQKLLARVSEYKRRYYQNQLVKGAIFFVAFALSIYLFANTAEFFGRFSSIIRATLFFGTLLFLAGGLYHWIINPLVHLYGLRRQLSDEEAARQIGQYFPEVGDKLLNTLQLQALTQQQSDLLQASLSQRSSQLLIVRFADAIQLEKNRRFIKYAALPIMVIGFLLLFFPAFLTKSSTRLIRYQEEFAEEAPFRFNVLNKNLRGFRNEDFTLSLKLTGDVLPDNLFLISGGTRFKMEPVSRGQYAYTFDNIQRDITFSFEASGYRSPTYDLEVIDRPGLLSFDVSLVYPSYLNKPAEQLANVGTLVIPEGTQVTWRFSAAYTDSIKLRFSDESAPRIAQKQSDSEFELTKTARRTTKYDVYLKNSVAGNRDKIEYNLNVVPDKFPQITLENFRDTTLFNYVILGGTLADDYGFSNLKLNYRVIRAGQSPGASYQTRQIPFNRSAVNQNFYYQWNIDSLRIEPGDRLEYYVQVWDNDAINGFKSARSPFSQFVVPDMKKMEQEASRSAEQTEKQIDKAIGKSQQLKQELNALENRLQTKKNLDFQDKKQAEDILKKRQELLDEIKQIQEQNKLNNERQQRFNQQSPELAQKFEQLQKLMNELLDPETQRLYEELKKLMDQKQDERVSDMLNRIKNKEKNLAKELERALNLFKQLQIDQKLESAVKDLEKQAEKQEKLAEESDKQATNKNNQQQDKKGPDEKQGNKSNPDAKPDGSDLEQKQEDLNKEFEQTKEDLKEIEKMSEELENKSDPDMQNDLQEEISQQQQESKQNLNQKQNNKASQSQRKAAKSMKNLSEKLSEQMQSAEMQEQQENMDDLRAILENLLTLSHDQERLMKDFKGVSLQDPRFVKLAQDQLKLQDDAKIIEDSLYSLANRVMQIQSFVTRELNSMKSYMDESVKFIRERRLNVATGKQQFAMTSINNLALMLSDVFKQMQQQMSQMAMPGKGKGKKKGRSESMSLGQMQKQLNERIQQLQKSGKQGRGMSEELSRLAEEQAAIRKMLKEIQDAQKGTETGKKLNNELNELSEKMNEAETELVNKRVNQDLIKRQQELLTRLLESEKAIKEQEEDLERKAKTASEVVRRPPPVLVESLLSRQKQVEVIRTVPVNLNTFYKQQVDKYLNTLKP